MPNPLRRLLDTTLPELDVGIMHHGFAEHGRDYEIIVENAFSRPPGTYRLTFTHVVSFDYRTALDGAAWQTSWSDDFTDYARWEAAGAPEGYVFGTNWSLAYPGFSAPEEHADAAAWSDRTGRPMYAAMLETDRFTLTLIYHDVRFERIAEGAPTVAQGIIPLGD